MTNKIYESWLQCNKISNELKQKMSEMSSEEIELAFNENPIQFGTAGFRAKMGPGNHYLNEITYYQLAIGYARFLKHKFLDTQLKVLVIHDNRLNGDFYSNVVATALKNEGITPILNTNNNLLPTPIASYLIRKLHVHGCINITASHNPKEYNGFKCYDDTGSQLLPYDTDQIISYLPTWQEALELYDNIFVEFEYLNQAAIIDYFYDVRKTLINKSKDKNLPKLKVVYSAMNGTGSFWMKPFLNSLGYECIDVEEQNYPDANFTNSQICNPEDPKALELAINLANQNNATVVIASDPDADRLSVAIKKDGVWHFLNGNQTGIIQTYYKLINQNIEDKTPTIISTYISTNLIDRIAQEYKGKVIRTATGFKWIASEINKLTENEEYIIGFEEAIGALPSTINRDKDAFQTAALILEIIDQYRSKNMDLIDLLEQEIYPKYGCWFGETVSLLIKDIDWKTKADNMLNLLRTSELDYIGARKIIHKEFNVNANAMEFIFANDSWIKFRISGTEPKFKIYTNLYPLTSNENNNITQSSIDLQNESKELVEFIKHYLNI